MMATGSMIPCFCPTCGAVTWIHCEDAQWEAYTAGALAQDAFPDMDPTSRETVISGLCADCQATFFADDEEEVDD